jgi:hypothetical protein
MKTNEIKKGMRIKSVQLGAPVTGIMMDNMRGNTRMVSTKGSEVGLFDETGSIYSHDIVLVETDSGWEEVEHTEKQIELKNKIKDFF